MAEPTIVEVHLGVCGFIARMEPSSEDRRNVSLRIRSDCENMRALAAAVAQPVDAAVRFAP